MAEPKYEIPGEWDILAPSRDGSQDIVDIDNPKDKIARVYNRIDPDITQATADLIAAAPKLGLALIEVYRKVDLRTVPGGSEELHKMVEEALTDSQALDW